MADLQTRARQLVDRLLDHVREHEPVELTRLGASERDGELPDLAPQALAARSRDLAVLSSEVDRALRHAPDDAVGEDREARDDLRLLADEVAHRRARLDVRPRFVLDPLAVLDTIAAGLHELLRREDLPAHERCRRLDAAAARARRVPHLLEQAGTLLASAPEPHLAVALRRLPAIVDLVRDELPRRAEALGADVTPARDAGEVAAEGLEAYAALLSELGEEIPADWRLGEEQHELVRRLGLGTTMGLDEIERRARTWMERIRGEMAELTARGWARRFPGEPVPADDAERIRRSLERIADDAVDRHDFVPEATRAVEEARRFALASGLTDVPPAARLGVAEVPDYLQGVWVAFLTPPPALDDRAGCTYYLSPVPDDWDDGQARRFLREYNPAQLRSLAVHEAYPGHFVQLEHASRHPRLARRLLTRPVFAEGWAVYVERVALEAGFAEEGTAVSPDDYRLTQRKLELRIASNALLDVGLHTRGLTDEAALELLTGSAFQQRDEARAQLTRAKVSGAQLCTYFVGGEELGLLRADVEQQEGRDFDLRRFHQRVLSHGTPTVDVVRDALADDAPSHRPFRATA